MLSTTQISYSECGENCQFNKHASVRLFGCQVYLYFSPAFFKHWFKKWNVYERALESSRIKIIMSGPNVYQ